MLDLKIVRYFDYYPSPEGFRGMKEREEFTLGPNEDYLYSLFHIVQATGNETVARSIRDGLDLQTLSNGDVLSQLFSRLDRGEQIAGRVSPGQYTVPHANFGAEDILHALASCVRPAPSAKVVA